MEGRLRLVYHSGCALIKNRINLLDIRAREEADLSLKVCPHEEQKPLRGNYCYLLVVLLTCVLKEWRSLTWPLLWLMPRSIDQHGKWLQNGKKGPRSFSLDPKKKIESGSSSPHYSHSANSLWGVIFPQICASSEKEEQRELECEEIGGRR